MKKYRSVCYNGLNMIWQNWSAYLDDYVYDSEISSLHTLTYAAALLSQKKLAQQSLHSTAIIMSPKQLRGNNWPVGITLYILMKLDMGKQTMILLPVCAAKLCFVKDQEFVKRINFQIVINRQPLTEK